ncbi:expressed hypothetical protein [Trichoplax adhaerens]|uniref:ACB domain-containing protein n=1 Tax=Trichoplax adhaerens TaxID=10228 RepID=B3RQT0_TRIAD|nr:expressed hypothetical protein [Trichoplax adhaerens]EDV26757.1 expressed hypothetical protein [Trichoplax adhaerens]|eukprot:XP_002110753.1 expressed hypothetical protein [Trichoplax adhaerens]
MEEEFKSAVDKINNLASKPSNEDLLEIYGLYKQATVGDCNTDRPGFFDQKNRAKWDSWNSKKGMSTEEAKQAYIKKANSL